MGSNSSSFTDEKKHYFIVFEARNLPQKDKIGRSTPFAEVEYGGKKKRGTSKYICSNPLWPDNVFIFDPKPNVSEVKISVSDLDLISKNEKFGEIKISLKDMKDGNVRDEWFELDSKELEKEDPKKRMSVHVRILYNGVLKYELSKQTKLPQFYDYKEYLPRMETGDIIFFCGLGLHSKLINKIYDSPYSHCGLVIKTKLKDSDEEDIFVFEATTNPDGAKDAYFPDMKVGETGTWIFRLSERLQVYNGSGIWWSPLQKPLNSEEKKAMMDWVMDVHDKKTQFQKWKDTFMSTFEMTENYENMRTLFCSEAVAEALRLAGRAPEGINVSTQSPDAIANFDSVHRPFILKYQLLSKNGKLPK